MNHLNDIRLITFLSKLVAGCAVPRGFRRLGLARIGWTLAISFALLGGLYLLLFAPSLQSFTSVEIKLNLAYAFAALGLSAFLVLLELSVRGRARLRQAQQRVEAELEVRVTARTEELTRANAELKETNATLQAEIDERKRMQDQMERSHREVLTVTRQAGMSEVATGVLHNVGNVLNSVGVSASLLADHLRQSKIEYVSRIAQLVREHAADLSEFITQDEKGRQIPVFLIQLADHLDDERLLLIKESDSIRTKIEHIKEIVATQQSYGKVSGVAERVRLTDVMDDVLQIQAAELAEHGVQVHREYQSPPPEMIVDKHKVLQILLNLVSNAKHACTDSTREDKQMTVKVTNGGNRVQVLVRDNGVGIPAANLNKIFNHGFTTRKKNGHGFGLHSGALAARELGGQLTAESEGPGKGATFTLELPLKPGPG